MHAVRLPPYTQPVSIPVQLGYFCRRRRASCPNITCSGPSHLDAQGSPLSGQHAWYPLPVWVTSLICKPHPLSCGWWQIKRSISSCIPHATCQLIQCIIVFPVAQHGTILRPAQPALVPTMDASQLNNQICDFVFGLNSFQRLRPGCCSGWIHKSTGALLDTS